MSEARQGAAFAVVAYVVWGVNPIYFKWLGAVPATEILVHRIVWSVVLLGAFVAITRRGAAARRVFETPRVLLWLLLSSTLVSANWLVFIWAIQHNRIVETSLGYFINPLFNVLLGVMVLRERILPLQALAVAVAAVGVLNEIWQVGVFPWVGLSLALTFGLYGLVRKRIGIDPVVGLGVETLLMMPIALVWLGMLITRGEQSFGTQGVGIDAALISAGVITSVPLVCFAAAANRLPLSILGLFQYIAPSIALLLAVFLYGEPFHDSQFVTFGCIWLGLAIFSGAAVYHERGRAGRTV